MDMTGSTAACRVVKRGVAMKGAKLHLRKAVIGLSANTANTRTHTL